MPEKGRGYSLPYAVDTGTRIGQIVIWLVATALWTAYGVWEWSRNPEGWVLLLPLPLLLLMMLQPLLECKAQLHLVPEGIAITLFGKTVRQFPAQSIRFLGVVPGNKNSDRLPKIAVCKYSLEELTALGKKHIPNLFRTEHEVWHGEFSGKYLILRGTMSLSGELNLHRKILWLDWSPERLVILRKLYPDVQWLDCTRDQRFEKQLNP